MAKHVFLVPKYRRGLVDEFKVDVVEADALNPRERRSRNNVLWVGGDDRDVGTLDGFLGIGKSSDDRVIVGEDGDLEADEALGSGSQFPHRRNYGRIHGRAGFKMGPRTWRPHGERKMFEFVGRWFAVLDRGEAAAGLETLLSAVSVSRGVTAMALSRLLLNSHQRYGRSRDC